MKTVSILGCGWLGLPLGAALVAQGYAVKGSTTHSGKVKTIADQGIRPFLLEVGERVTGNEIERFFQSEILVLNIPPGRKQQDVEKRFPQQVELITEAAMHGGIHKILFVSSTSVYPSSNQTVSETTPVEPETASGRALVAAEKYLREKESLAVTILRLAGLVGGDRHPGRWFAGKKNLDGGKVPVNLVHRRDVITAITALLDQEKWGEVYQFSADEHPLKEDFYPAMSRQLGLEVPEFDGAGDQPFKIVENEKIKRDLGLDLEFPDPMGFFI